MEKFEITILGCGAALPTPRRLSSAQVVNIRQKLFMLDCAEGTQMALRRSRLSFSHLQAIFLTHLHGDHTFGLIGLLSTFALLGRIQDLHIYGPQDLLRIFQPQIDASIHPTKSSSTKSTPILLKPSTKTAPSPSPPFLSPIASHAAATSSRRNPPFATFAVTASSSTTSPSPKSTTSRQAWIGKPMMAPSFLTTI